MFAGLLPGLKTPLICYLFAGEGTGHASHCLACITVSTEVSGTVPEHSLPG